MRAGQKFDAIANCHAPGLYSIPVNVREHSVDRIFIDTLGKAHTVAPHNHRYPLRLTVLRGELTHSVWEPDPTGAIEMWRYQWHSPLTGHAGRFALKDEASSRFNVSTDWMSPGEYVHLRPEQYHSLGTDPGAVWMVTEGLDTQDSETLWSEPVYAPDLAGLYVPFPAVSA